MSGLLFLNNDDFFIESNGKTNIMRTQFDNGFLLVLFYSTHCKYCKKAIDVFKSLPKQLQGCSFGIINVSTNAKTAIMSKDTSNPIQYVPFIILYKDGIPKYQYKDNLDPESISNFILYAAEQLKTSFSAEKETAKVPEYTIGVPVCDGDVCYMSYDGAYEKK